MENWVLMATLEKLEHVSNVKQIGLHLPLSKLGEPPIKSEWAVLVVER
ncbi:hypothetical protein L195_g021116 [Trifolium pratense]|uniref:Uncharacterized protein n=1 Tax=Trifolium pratense TaxID=57577 RepID=A0A2K3MD31_TRIPR|nr:hypothetical protein L195_g034956 [Trifolium pratense]PNX88703.1 hypothetical protein L195_g044815 [Trifolium pratense]PNX97879.1 hypothetical protein L195_g021116 [Trifolium pratense]